MCPYPDDIFTVLTRFVLMEERRKAKERGKQKSLTHRPTATQLPILHRRCTTRLVSQSRFLNYSAVHEDPSCQNPQTPTHTSINTHQRRLQLITHLSLSASRLLPTSSKPKSYHFLFYSGIYTRKGYVSIRDSGGLIPPSPFPAFFFLGPGPQEMAHSHPYVLPKHENSPPVTSPSVGRRACRPRDRYMP